MTINRRGFIAGTAGFSVAGMLLAACGSSSGSSASSGSKSAGASSASSGGNTTTLVEAVAGLPTGFSFDTAPSGYENMEFNNNTNACLIRAPYVQSTRTPTAKTQDVYKFEGVLAESYDVSADGLVYTFHLRKGVLSQQGNPFTADDVLFSYERKYNSTSITPFVSAPAITDPAKQFKKIDDFTVQMTVARQSDGFTLLALLANVTAEIYDSTYLKKNATKSDPYALAVSNTKGNFGYGAYMLDSFTPGQQMILKSNPHFALGEPAIKQITQRVVADAGTRASILRNGDVDIAVQLRPSDVETLSTVKGVNTFEVDTNDYLWMTLQTSTAPFNDVKVRQALQMAINYPQIISSVYKGRADKMNGWLDPAAPGYTTDGLFYPAYDPTKAKALLKDAGHSGNVAFQLLISDAVPDLEEAAIQIRTSAAAAGFDVTILKQPAATAGANQSAGKFQAVMIRDMAISLSPPYELLLEYTKGSPLNSGHWEYDPYYAAVAAGVAAGDALSAAAGKEWSAAMAIALDQVPQISIARVQPLMVFRDNVHGFAHRTDNVVDFSIITKT
jgi:peptide/nickel transport system substrate-binding protein